MFKPHYGICKGTDKYEGCGQNGLITTRSRGLCTLCESKRKTKPTTAKKAPKNLVQNKEYYAQRITDNMIKNKGKCICEECGDEIKRPVGRNVSHIVGGGANTALYLESINSKILCLKCEDIWTNGDKTKMKIYPECMEIRQQLNLKYYTQKSPID